MKYYKMSVVFALIVSLIMNFVLLSKLDIIEHQISNISNYQSHMMNTVDSQTSNIQHVMNEIKKEQSWISTINMGVDTKEAGNGKVEMNFDWQVKELHNNSKVIFNYKFGEEEEFKSIPAVEKQTGLYQVSIPVKIKFEPQWEIRLMVSGNSERELNEKELEEQRKAYYGERTLSYFVSVSYKDMIKNGEIHSTNIENLGARDYGLLEAMVDITNNNFHVLVINPVVRHDNPIFLKEAYILKYKNGDFVEEEQLISDNQDVASRDRPIFFRMDQSEKLDYTSLAVKAVYSNGEVFEKEVYSE